MRRFAPAAAALLLAAPASAASLGGHDALALGALVGLRSPALAAHRRAHLAMLLDDRAASVPHGAIVVTADAATCRAGDVDVAAFSCALTFGARTVTLVGRAAHELYATIVEAGVPSDGAAGTIFEALHGLSCTLDPAKLAQRDGGGADCTFQPGPP